MCLLQEPPSQRESIDASSAAALSSPPKTQSFEQIAADRSAKIARLKAKKEMEKKIKVVQLVFSPDPFSC